MGQIECRIPVEFAQSLAAGLRDSGRLDLEVPRGTAILAGRVESSRIEVRADGSFSYGDSPRLQALLIQMLKGVLPVAPSRFLVGIDEAGIGGEANTPFLAVAVISSTAVAEFIASGTRDSKTIHSKDELQRIAGYVRENAVVARLFPIRRDDATVPFSKAVAACAADALRTMDDASQIPVGAPIRIDQIDRDVLLQALGTNTDLASRIEILAGAEEHVEVAAASVLATEAARVSGIPPHVVGRPPKAVGLGHFVVGPHKAQDREQVVAVLRRLEHSYPDIGRWIDKGGPGGLWDQVENRDYHLLVARMDSEVVGFCLSRKKDDRNAKISTFYVAPKYRNRHIGSRLLQQELFRLAKLKVRRVMVTFSHEEFAEMQPFFGRFGFSIDGISPQRYRDNSYEVIMGRRFQGRTLKPGEIHEFARHDMFQMEGHDVAKFDERTFFATPRRDLFASHQLTTGRRYLVRTTESPSPEAELEDIRTIARVQAAQPVLVAAHGWPADARIPAEVLILDAHAIETSFFPLTIERPADADLIIPIAPTYANRLIPSAHQTTFAPEAVGLRSENVFYRVAMGGADLRRGARLFFYVSEPRSEIVGCARLQSIHFGSASKLHASHGGLGAWSRRQLEEHLEGREGMAYRFDWFEELPQPVPLSGIRRIRKSFNPITVFKIRRDEGDAIRVAGGLT